MKTEALTEFTKNFFSKFNNPAIIVIVIAWGISAFSLGMLISRHSGGFAWNLLGDAMGGIFGTLISSMTLIFVAYSFQLQSNALKIQKEELQGTRDEFIKQNKTIKKDNFENTFFKLTEKQQSLIKTFHFKDKLGYEALDSAKNYIGLVEFNSSWTELNNLLSRDFASFIKINNVITKLIDTSFESAEEKQTYKDILDALHPDIIKTIMAEYPVYEKKLSLQRKSSNS